MKTLMSRMMVATGALGFANDLFAQERYYEWRWQIHPMWWGVWGIGMMLMMFLFWILVVVGLVVALSSGPMPTGVIALAVAVGFGLAAGAWSLVAWTPASGATDGLRPRTTRRAWPSRAA